MGRAPNNGTNQQLGRADSVRRIVAPQIAQRRKSELGQFMTPSRIAEFMASLFPEPTAAACRLLDAGAGVGSLSCAFLDRWVGGELVFDSVDVFAYEIDDALRVHLADHLCAYEGIRPHIHGEDFIESAGLPLIHGFGNFTHAILNPPYKKINSDSSHRHVLRKLGIETVNLYSAFVALAIAHAGQGAQIVAIIPRSFCNGPYYRPFRDFLLSRTALRHMHLFESRSKAFKDDDVLQENIIIRLECGRQQGAVTISTSTDDTFSDLVTHEHPFNRIVFSDDPERFIHVPTSPGRTAIERSPAIRYSLAELGIKVSTGPVVDFRLKEHTREMPAAGTVPLLYPGHFNNRGTEWPISGMKKPNAIEWNDHTERWLYPNGFYCVVRRFSSKEEKRRVVASVVDPSSFKGAKALGFENHLNLFHEEKHGLSPELASGLALFLNSTAVDESFRRFNGHTQVNATDLKLIKYPSRANLTLLGKWALTNGHLTQAMIDERLDTLSA
jgi:adenine-specific DNA-methyltransferase